MSARVSSALDAVVAIAQKLYGFLGNAIIRHRAEQLLSQLWQEGYVPIRTEEVHRWRIRVRAIAGEKHLSAEQLSAELILIAGAMDNFLGEWRKHHERQPQQTETRFRAGVNSRNQRKR